MELSTVLPSSASETRAEDQPYLFRIGYGAVAASFFLFLLYDLKFSARNENWLILFFIHFGIAIGYSIALAGGDAFGVRKSWRGFNIHYTILLLVLYLISAFALNRGMLVFENSTEWWSICLIICCLTMMTFRWFRDLPTVIRQIQVFLLGVSLVVFLYLTIMVGYVYLLALIGTLFFGIGVHAFIPVALLAACVFLVAQNFRERTFPTYPLFAGICLPLIALFWFTVVWTGRITAMERTANNAVLENAAGIPAYIKAAQFAEEDWIMDRILKTNIVYSTAYDHFGSFRFFDGGRMSWDERNTHDPLVMVASMSSLPSLSREERIKILTILSSERHRAVERLWSGDQLTTSYVVSDVDIYPDLHIAYTEKYLNVRNSSPADSWRNNQEAIYTFQLPEGSVVTSLSLWINGKEEKAVLTSKQKAAKAYNTIVGTQMRDPSVVHWQEGSTVSVRVFPCTQHEERKFKIGISSLLTRKGNSMIYKSIRFTGPDAANAKETTRIRFITPPKQLILPDYFTKNEKGNLVAEHAYNPNLEIVMEAPELKANRFTHDHFTYSLSTFEPSPQHAEIRKIYLDINNSWTQPELDEIKKIAASRECYVESENELIRATPDNWHLVTGSLRKRNFSTFPFYLIEDADHSLIITKGTDVSVRLSDFKESLFAQNVREYFSKGRRLKVYNLSATPSTYVNTLRELRAFQFTSGDVHRLQRLLVENKFPDAGETDSKVVVYDAGVAIMRKATNDSTDADNAPDHLARLFAYNDVMRRTGESYLVDKFEDLSVQEEASMANIVSPVSSLIVLEKQEDYDRFDIRDSENSLHNASRQSSGAVPEPHEWALIAVVVLFLLFLRLRR